jgi:hypothetical protein
VIGTSLPSISCGRVGFHNSRTPIYYIDPKFKIPNLRNPLQVSQVASEGMKLLKKELLQFI